MTIQVSDSNIYTFLMAIVAAAPSTIMAIAAFRKSKENGDKIQDLHIIVNSRLTELLALTKTSSESEGFARGTKESERHRSSPSAQE